MSIIIGLHFNVLYKLHTEIKLFNFELYRLLTNIL